jgi:hypothetical protein
VRHEVLRRALRDHVAELDVGHRMDELAVRGHDAIPRLRVDAEHLDLGLLPAPERAARRSVDRDRDRLVRSSGASPMVSVPT